MKNPSRTAAFAAVSAALLAITLLPGCDRGPAPVEGFVLPEGDVERGQQVFAEIGCRYCHTIANVDFPPFEAEPVMEITLGGKVLKVKSYGELLNSIVNPDHAIAVQYRAKLPPEERWDETTSPMPVFNDVLTVSELIDLTAFLHERYEMLGSAYRGYMYVP